MSLKLTVHPLPDLIFCLSMLVVFQIKKKETVKGCDEIPENEISSAKNTR
jgi:hypothetical protein